MQLTVSPFLGGRRGERVCTYATRTFSQPLVRLYELHDPQVGFAILYHFLWAEGITVYQTSVCCGSSTEHSGRRRRGCRIFVVGCEIMW